MFMITVTKYEYSRRNIYQNLQKHMKLVFEKTHDA
jgi:hypothetical protein